METERLQFDMRGLIENSLLEWEGMVATVVIAGGCNFRCPYCHSWRYVTGLDDLHPIGLDKLFAVLDRQRGWIDGVVFTGGEATVQPDLRRVMELVRDYEVRIKLHTNGTRPAVIREVVEAGLVDCLSLDYKAPLDDRLFAACGIGQDEALLAAVRESFAFAAGSSIEREYHTTLAPQYVDGAVLAEMAETLEPGGLWILQQLETADCLDPAIGGTVRYTGEQLDQLLATARTGHERVILKKGSSA